MVRPARRGLVSNLQCPSRHLGRTRNILEPRNSAMSLSIGVSQPTKFFEHLSPSPPSTVIHPTASPHSSDFQSASRASLLAHSAIILHVVPSCRTQDSDTIGSGGRFRGSPISNFQIVSIQPSLHGFPLPVSKLTGARYFPPDPGLMYSLAAIPALIALSPELGPPPGSRGSFFLQLCARPSAQLFLRGPPRP